VFIADYEHPRVSSVSRGNPDFFGSHEESIRVEEWLTLNGAHWTIRRHVVTIGLANRTMVHPREVFWPAIRDNAVAIVVAHNHPSGQIDPSNEDREVTRRLVAAGEIIGIPVLDHVIIGRDRYYSFLESGLI